MAPLTARQIGILKGIVHGINHLLRYTHPHAKFDQAIDGEEIVVIHDASLGGGGTGGAGGGGGGGGGGVGGGGGGGGAAVMNRLANC